jgi:antitoxin ParD1/3/4
MAAIERLMVTLPADMAVRVKGALSHGDNASSSEVIHEALGDREIKSELRRRKLEAVRCDIDDGLTDLEAGRLRERNLDDIMTREMRLPAACHPSV